ncbi:MAG: hypothetical protein CMP49_02575 [Flavobacteriales bacterium]|nr:hypothetical protein [Flavobacteriales bacterium]|tara:strand:+ start:623 stop:1063 length:441 start_codon:yes stop_codon:yes gene_type:complete
MKLKFIFFGKKNDSLLESYISKYLKRLNKYIKSEIIFLSEKNELKIKKNFTSIIKPSNYIITLNEKAQTMNTIKYAKFLRKKVEDFDSVILIVGDAYGIPKSIISKSNYSLSLSEMTLPHLIARLVLVEQTYRVFTIFNNHPYHHE